MLRRFSVFIFLYLSFSKSFRADRVTDWIWLTFVCIFWECLEISMKDCLEEDRTSSRDTFSFLLGWLSEVSDFSFFRVMGRVCIFYSIFCLVCCCFCISFWMCFCNSSNIFLRGFCLYCWFLFSIFLICNNNTNNNNENNVLIDCIIYYNILKYVLCCFLILF